MPKDDDHEGGAGYSGPALERAHRLLDFADEHGPPVPLEKKWEWGPDGAPQSSPNHEAEVWTTNAAIAAANHDAKAFERAKGVLLEAYYPRELARGPRAVGLWASETLCPDNHTHQHLAGPPMGRVAAVLSQDSDLLRLSGEHLAVTVGALRAFATAPANHAALRPGDLLMASAGTRCHGKPVWWAGAAFLRAAHLYSRTPGLDTRARAMAPMPEYAKNPSLWRDGVSVGVRALRWLAERPPEVGDKEPSLPELPETPLPCAVKYPVRVHRGRRVILVVMERPRGGRPVPQQVCDWVEFPAAPRDFRDLTQQTRWGNDFQTPPPDPPDGPVIRFPSPWE